MNDESLHVFSTHRRLRNNVIIGLCILALLAFAANLLHADDLLLKIGNSTENVNSAP